MDIKSFIEYCKNNVSIHLTNFNQDMTLIFKKGGSIHIKKENKGKFTDYCNGKVTEDCIQKGKHSKDPKIRKRATFASNVRKWSKKN